MPLRKPDSSSFKNADHLSADLARINAPFPAVSVAAEELLCLRTQSAVAGLGRSRHLFGGYQFSACGVGMRSYGAGTTPVSK
jgi:hypothetical protein